jgi:hypothetical protein
MLWHFPASPAPTRAVIGHSFLRHFPSRFDLHNTLTPLFVVVPGCHSDHLYTIVNKLPQSIEHLTILCGTNELHSPGTSALQVAQELERLSRHAMARLPNLAHVTLTLVPPKVLRSDGHYAHNVIVYNSKIRALNHFLVERQRKVGFLRLLNLSLDTVPRALRTLLSRDGYHPNGYGVNFMCRNLKWHLAEIAGELANSQRRRGRNGSLGLHCVGPVPLDTGYPDLTKFVASFGLAPFASQPSPLLPTPPTTSPSAPLALPASQHISRDVSATSSQVLHEIVPTSVPESSPLFSIPPQATFPTSQLPGCLHPISPTSVPAPSALPPVPPQVALPPSPQPVSFHHVSPDDAFTSGSQEGMPPNAVADQEDEVEATTPSPQSQRPAKKRNCNATPPSIGNLHTSQTASSTYTN